jgi:hypothetical protein
LKGVGTVVGVLNFLVAVVLMIFDIHGDVHGVVD